MFKLQSPQQNQGFSLVEVLVAILITTLFVAVAMQSMAIAAVFKARAQELSEATTWIQQDLEEVKYTAANFKYTSLSANAALGALTINVNSLNDLEVNDKLKVGSAPGTYIITAILGNTLTITPGLVTAQSQDAVVGAITRCKNSKLTADAASGASSITVASGDSFSSGDTFQVGSNPSIYTIAAILGNTLTITPGLATAQTQGDLVVGTPAIGFADGLRDKIIGSDRTDIIPYSEPTVIKTSDRTRKIFNMTRTTNISTIPTTIPYNVLEVKYTVSPTSGGSPVASLSSEVIPNAAFQCP